MIGSKVIQKTDGAASKEVKRWRFLLQKGIEYRDTQDKRWTANESCVDMKMWQNADGSWSEGSDDEPSINKAGSFMRTYRAAIAYKNPRAKMKPKNAKGYEPIPVPVMGENGLPKQDQMGQVIAKPVLRYQLRETLINNILGDVMFGLFGTLGRVIFAACQGYGAAMVGYKPTFATAPEKETDDEIPIVDGQMDLSGFEIDALTGLPLRGDNGEPIRKNHLPVYEEWFFDWVPYRNLIHDPRGGNDFMKHRWVAIEEVRTLEEVKADKLYKNTKFLQATGSMEIGTSENRSVPNADVSDDDIGLVRLFRIFDLVKNKMIVLADGHDKPLFDDIMPRGITHCPLGFFRPTERICKTEDFYPRAPLTDAIPLITEKNNMRRQQYIGAKRAIRKILAEKGFLEEEAIEKLSNDVDMEVVTLEKTTMYGIEKAIHVLAMPAVNQDVYGVMRASDADFDEVMGQGTASRGGSSGDTATETNKRSQYEVTRYDFDRKQFADFLREMFKKLDDSIDANMTIPRAIEVAGDDGQAFTTLVDRDMIACDCEIDIDVQEMAPTDSEAEAARMIQFAQVIGQNPWMAANEVVLRTFAERLRIKDENFIKEFVMLAQQQMAMQQQAKAGSPQPKVPNAPPPENEAQAIQQTGGGVQVPNMQGAA